MKRVTKLFLAAACAAATIMASSAQPTAMQNVMGRERISLNGKWATIPDQMNIGYGKKSWGSPKLGRVTDQLRELYYEGGETLNVPGDWNSQNPEYVYFEAPMWYKKSFLYTAQNKTRQFLHFAAVCENAVVYLNGELLGKHSGGFTPFQFEVTGKLAEGENYVIVRVDNTRTPDTIPAMHFDWWIYGGITRDVDLVITPETFVEDYWVRLVKGSMERVAIDVTLSGADKANAQVVVSIPEAKISKRLTTDAEGNASIEFDAKKLHLWSPEDPHLYEVVVKSKKDEVRDQIGLRSFEVKGTEMLLNGKPQFLRGINIHEEIALDRRRSIDALDAEMLTNEALALGCNFIRLSHYPHNEYMVKMCERKGIMMWEEIPVWQGINFANPKVCEAATNMMHEMIERDKNRCGIVMWSISNETYWSNKARNEFLPKLAAQTRAWDDTRAVTSALNHSVYKDGETDLTLVDPLAEHLDVIGLNKYMGWYDAWKKSPADTKWTTIADKPMIFSEFGAEAIFGNYGDGENLNAWSEDYMKKAYEDDLTCFTKIPNFRGCAPWIMFDFRSPRRSHAMYQQGWNRKGLISPEGNRKEAWHIMNKFYESKK